MVPDSGVRMIPIVSTSLNEDGEFDVDSLWRLVQSLVVLGAPCDLYSLTNMQRLDVVRVSAWQVSQRVAILVGGAITAKRRRRSPRWACE